MGAENSHLMVVFITFVRRERHFDLLSKCGNCSEQPSGCLKPITSRRQCRYGTQRLRQAGQILLLINEIQGLIKVRASSAVLRTLSSQVAQVRLRNRDALLVATSAVKGKRLLHEGPSLVEVTAHQGKPSEVPEVRGDHGFCPESPTYRQCLLRTSRRPDIISPNTCHPGLHHERLGDRLVLTVPSAKFQTLLQERICCSEVPLPNRKCSGPCKDPRTAGQRLVNCREDPLEPLAALGKMSANLPEPPNRCSDAQRRTRFLGQHPLECKPKIVVVGVQPVEP